MTQVQLAEASGVKQSTISELERGDIKNPSLGSARRLARALRMPVDRLFPSNAEPADEPAKVAG